MTHRTVVGVPSPTRLEPGDRIGDKFLVRRILGRGASATVYEAEHIEIGNLVAVKVVHADASREPHHLSRFRREARICGQVRSPHVPQVYDVGRLEDGSPYLVMELLDGPTLEADIVQGPAPLHLVFEVGEQLMQALHAVHSARAVHRDVKPENIVLSRDASSRLTLKLVDFGISKSLDEPHNVTVEGMVLGTPHYMAPEQVEGLVLDERVDIYAAGAVLYEMITGRTPYQGTTADEVMTAVQRDPIIPPGVFRDDCPMELDALVMKAMSREPQDRFSSAPEMRDALKDAERHWHRESRPTPLVNRKHREVVDAALGGAAAAGVGAIGAASVGAAAANDLRETRDTVRTRSKAPAALEVDEEELDAPRERGVGRWSAAIAAVLLVLGSLAAAAILSDTRPDSMASRAGGPGTAPSPAPAAAPRFPSEPPSGGELGGHDLLDRHVVGGLELRSASADSEAGAEALDAPGDDPDGTGVASEPGAPAAGAEEVAAVSSSVEDGTGEGAAEDADDVRVKAEDAKSEETRGDRRERARRRVPPTTTVMPARQDPQELRQQIRTEVREAMLRDWPDGDDDGADAADRANGGDAARDLPPAGSPSRDLPSILRSNPYDAPTGGTFQRENPYDDGRRESVPANPFEAPSR